MKTNQLNFKNEDNSKIFFTADLHFGHKLMMKIRGFESLIEMDRMLVENWNKTVPKDGKVFVLGDLIWYNNTNMITNLFDALNGDIYFIWGNHDDQLLKNDLISHDKIKYVSAYTELKVKIEDENYEIILSHFPFEIWNKKHYGSCHLHGHCHGQLEVNSKIRRLDVGIDNHPDLRPFSFSEVVEVMANIDYETFTK